MYEMLSHYSIASTKLEDGTTSRLNLYQVHSCKWSYFVLKWVKPHPSVTWNYG